MPPPQPAANPWEALEALPGLIAVPAVWQRRMGEHFPALRATCLDPDTWQVASYPCPLKCGCWHQVILRPPSDPRPSLPRQSQTQAGDGRGIKGEGSPDSELRTSDFGLRTLDPPAAVGVCRCTPPACPDLPLSLADITPLKLNWKKLGRELCHALNLTSKFAVLTPPNTAQIGSWSADAVPAILTIHIERAHFRSAVAELVATLNAPFILFAPTSDQFTAHTQALLAHAKAAFFPLDATVAISPAGTLAPVRPPGELFARFTPEPRDLPEDLARRAFALVQQFDSDTLAVFRLFCIDGLTAPQAAKKLRCSRVTVWRRLQTIHAKTGIPPEELRKLSPHIAQIENQLADPRARRIHPQSLITGEDPDPDE